MKKKDYVNLDNASTQDQKEAMERIKDRGECPFCRENLEKEHNEKILKEGEFWVITTNQFRYKQAELRFLVIAKEHSEHLKDLSPEAWTELLLHLQWAEKEFHIDSGGIGMRIGDVRYNGGTVAHLHLHLFKPKKPEDAEDYEPIRFRIGGRKKPRDV